MNAITWAKGLIASIISSVATTLLAVMGSNATGSPLNWTQIANVAAFSAIVGACLYLKQSPIPSELYSKTQTTTATTTISTIPISGVDLKDK